MRVQSEKAAMILNSWGSRCHGAIEVQELCYRELPVISKGEKRWEWSGTSFRHSTDLTPGTGERKWKRIGEQESEMAVYLWESPRPAGNPEPGSGVLPELGQWWGNRAPVWTLRGHWWCGGGRLSADGPPCRKFSLKGHLCRASPWLLPVITWNNLF